MVRFVQAGAELIEEGSGEEEETRFDPAWVARYDWYLKFWTEFLANLRLDDTSQPMARPTRSENIYFSQPPSGSQAWISAYFAQSKKQVGVYFRFQRGAYADSAYKLLLEDREAIEAELDCAVNWRDLRVKTGLGTAMTYDTLEDPATRLRISEYFAPNAEQSSSTRCDRAWIASQSNFKATHDSLMSSRAIAWYDRHASTVANTYESLDFKAAHGWLLQLLPDRPGVVLDVGAGSGRDAAGFAALGHDVVAVEPSASMVREGSVRHGILGSHGSTIDCRRSTLRMPRVSRSI